MEDRSRLEHLMGIAQSLRHRGSNSGPAAITSTEQQSFNPPPQRHSQSDAKAIHGVNLGSGIFSALSMSKDSSPHDTNLLTEAVSSIPRCVARDLRVHCTSLQSIDANCCCLLQHSRCAHACGAGGG
jgi:hypothetical protein